METDEEIFVSKYFFFFGHDPFYVETEFLRTYKDYPKSILSF